MSWGDPYLIAWLEAARREPFSDLAYAAEGVARNDDPRQ